MHPSARSNGALFFETYGPAFTAGRVVDIGAQDVNGSLREVCPPHLEYVGVDFVAGRGVDVILDDPYKLPFDDASVDIVVSSSCFEHSPMFWLLFLEVLRIIKPAGLFYLNAPSNGVFHRYPVDCWRFYPDSGAALVEWAQRSGYRPSLLESFVSGQDRDVWNDFVAVFAKDELHVNRFSERILSRHPSYTNGWTAGDSELRNFSEATEDHRLAMPAYLRKKLGLGRWPRMR